MTVTVVSLAILLLWDTPMVKRHRVAVSFLNRASIMRTLHHIPEGARVEIDATRTASIDHDVYEMIKEFEQQARDEGIDLHIRGLGALRLENDSMRRVHRIDPARARPRRSSWRRGARRHRTVPPAFVHSCIRALPHFPYAVR